MREKKAQGLGDDRSDLEREMGIPRRGAGCLAWLWLVIAAVLLPLIWQLISAILEQKIAEAERPTPPHIRELEKRLNERPQRQ